MKNKILPLLILLLLFTGCTKSRLKKTVNVPVPEDLYRYFEKEIVRTGGIPYHSDIEETFTVLKSIYLLRDYSTLHNVKEYPAWNVKRSLSLMAHEIGYIESHGVPDNLEDILDFFHSYLDQVFRLCPDVSLLTDQYSPDKQLGVLSFTGWSSYPMLSYLIYPDYKGGYRVTLWSINEQLFEKIFPIEKDGKQYYLLMGLDSYVFSPPVISLVSFNEKGIKEHLEPIGYEIEELFRIEENEKIIFNPKELCWQKCKLNQNGYWVQIDNTPTARLIWGKKNRILLEK